MRDEMDGRVWTAHHDDFSKSLELALISLGATLRGASPIAAKQLIAGIAALGMALLTVGGSVA